MNVAFLFPGQGAQKVGMGRDLYDASTAARLTFEEADAALGEKLTDLIFNGPADQLTLTANTQPAILTMSIAALRAFREKCDVIPTFVAGHSLGEFSALVAAEALGFADAVRLTRARGTYMQEAVPPNEGAMAAIMGNLTPEKIAEICAEVSNGQIVAPANFNAPGQVVISGHAQAVQRASYALQAADAKVIPLSVSAPFHCALMKQAALRLGEFLREINFRTPEVPIVTNVEARPYQELEQLKELLVRQVTSPVRWTESMQAMIRAQVDLFLEFGPGNVLAGLLKRIDRQVRVETVNSLMSLDKAKESLKTL